jgi:hypothetical protein
MTDQVNYIMVYAEIGGRPVAHIETIPGDSPGWGALPALDRAAEAFRRRLDGAEVADSAADVR